MEKPYSSVDQFLHLCADYQATANSFEMPVITSLAMRTIEKTFAARIEVADSGDPTTSRNRFAELIQASDPTVEIIDSPATGLDERKIGLTASRFREVQFAPGGQTDGHPLPDGLHEVASLVHKYHLNPSRTIVNLSLARTAAEMSFYSADFAQVTNLVRSSQGLYRQDSVSERFREITVVLARNLGRLTLIGGLYSTEQPHTFDDYPVNYHLPITAR